jgi:hypothetical protein
MRPVTARMYHAFWNAFMIEMKDLLAEMKILDQGRTALANLQGILIISDRTALCGGQDLTVPLRDLVKLASVSS